MFGCFWRQRHVLTNHVCGYMRIVAVFVKNETHCSLIRSVGKLLPCRHTSCTCLMFCGRVGGRHCAFAIVCPMSLSTAGSTLGFPLFNSFSRRQRSSTSPCLCFYLYLFLSPSHSKGKLMHSFVPIVHLFQGQDRRYMCQRRRAISPSQLPRKQ